MNKMPKSKSQIQQDYARRTGYAAQRKYDKENAWRMQLKFIQSTESDLIEKLESVPNKSGYIKSLIRADLAKSSDPS